MAINSITDFLDFNHGVVNINDTHDNLSPYSQHLVKEIREKDFGIDLVYFSGEFPSIYFKEVQSFQEPILVEIRETHRKIWNQGKVPFLYVNSPNEIRIYNCYYEPINPNNNNAHIDDALLFNATKSNLKDLEELRNVFGKVSIETGQFWKKNKYAKKLTNQSRINQVLIENLKHTRKVLHKEYGIDYSIIHDLLLRSLFLLYLEDRGATNDEFYQNILPESIGYYDILEKDISATYRLFAVLESSFNGNLCPVTQDELDLINLAHLQTIRECFWDKIELHGQQKLFDWKTFDFKYIPIELISEIYEDFLLKEEGEDQKAKDGAYYTPHTLVDFILNKVLPWGSTNKKANNYNIKVLDPTCGSGIFLVEAFKRLVDRWKQNNPSEKISFEILIELVRNNIFGIELNKEAIKVAAFSLYLAMLDNLEPKTLWKEKAFPYLIYDPKNEDDSTQGHNLFRMSSLGNGPFEEIKFDLIVGNPPFKEGKLDKETKDYNDQRNYPQEMVVAFLDRVSYLCPNGKIALVAAVKPVLFNTLSTYQNFRQFLFNENYVEEIYNFSILRKTSRKYGGNLFASAVGPACVIFYQKHKPKDYSDLLLYCAPKTAIKNSIIDGIAIDQTDIKYLPRIECNKPNTKIWKTAMWGTDRDFRFINLLDKHKSIGDILIEKENHGWNMGVGFETSHPADKPDSEISQVPHIHASRIERYFTPESSTTNIDIKLFRRRGAKRAYLAPHVLIKKGQSKKRFCASYLDYDCSYRDAVYGINGESHLLKLLTAFLNSSLASYYLFLTSSSWGVEREKIMSNEWMKLPAFVFDFNESWQKKIIEKFDEIVNSKKNEFLGVDEHILIIEKEIDKLIFKASEFDKEQIALIENVLSSSLDLFNKGENSEARKTCTKHGHKQYAEIICGEINNLLKQSSNLRGWATIYNIPLRTPLNLVSIHLNSKEAPNSVKNEFSEAKIEELLAQIEKYTYDQFSESLYYRKTVRYYKGDTIYIIKPNERRFWSKSLALSDADEIILEVSNS
ncbi:N-6 DNA methylase [Fulvivirga sp. M361]|uniref:HsdM family class I SAM-dependent methyltransferase n=1 Tax=Fulvivirga sp. M361 TaxID=2594266 RepID=UPI00117A5598|nr:N-6 DNA methylase [Fulvivirga sp. M361]TRX59217.1 N-6 DNA methylase [Fulvivirga sp. M361]